MIQVSHLHHHYGIRPVLRDVSFEVAGGELLAVMGPNGMGKSTLLSCLAGTLTPMEGEVCIDGRTRRGSVDDEQALRSTCVYLPDRPWLPGQISGRELLLATGKIYDVPLPRLFDHVDRLLNLFHLEEKGDQAISSYSNGQKKKIAVAAALVSDARVFILDEPFTGGLDPSGIHALKEVLSALRRHEDVTVVIASQIAEMVEAIADRVLVMEAGEVLACGTLAELRRQTNRGIDDEARLDALLERLIDPGGEARIHDYLEAEAP